jgi:hypothetical protein
MGGTFVGFYIGYIYGVDLGARYMLNLLKDNGCVNKEKFKQWQHRLENDHDEEF